MSESSQSELVRLHAEQVSGEVQYFPGELRLANRGLLGLALGYRRSRDFDPGNHAGQDAAALWADKEFVIGVVADGVSQSFFGNIAAQELVDFLAEMLWNDRESPLSSEQMEQSLARCRERADSRVRELRLPPDLPAMVVQALELNRLKGSQAVFAAFVLDASKRLLRGFLVGDVQVFIKTAGAPIKRMEANRRGRWSTTGKARLLMEPFELRDVEYVLVRSDGASPGLGLEGLPSRDEFTETLLEHGHEDDVSFVAVAISPRARVDVSKAARGAREGAGSDSAVGQDPSTPRRLGAPPGPGPTSSWRPPTMLLLAALMYAAGLVSGLGAAYVPWVRLPRPPPSTPIPGPSWLKVGSTKAQREPPFRIDEHWLVPSREDGRPPLQSPAPGVAAPLPERGTPPCALPAPG